MGLDATHQKGCLENFFLIGKRWELPVKGIYVYSLKMYTKIMGIVDMFFFKYNFWFKGRT